MPKPLVYCKSLWYHIKDHLWCLKIKSKSTTFKLHFEKRQTPFFFFFFTMPSLKTHLLFSDKLFWLLLLLIHVDWSYRHPDRYYWSMMLRFSHLGPPCTNVNKHPFTRAFSKWRRNSICQHSSKNYFVVCFSPISHQTKLLWWNPQTGWRLTVYALHVDG